MTETLLFIFVVFFSDAPSVVTGMETRQTCEALRASVEPELRALGAVRVISPCVPVLVRRSPEA